MLKTASPDKRFRDALFRIVGSQQKVLKTGEISTPLGPMIAIGDEENLYLLEFIERQGLEGEIERFKKKTKATETRGDAGSIKSIERELSLYFSGKLREFKTQVAVLGSPFQKSVWEQLRKIPCGETRSYADIAKALERPTAFRAVAQANRTNQLAIIIPCHRVINASGALAGYAGGVHRKQWLLDHERGMRK